MASISSTEYRIFFGQPVIVRAEAGRYANATFQRLRLKVSVVGSEFEFSSPVAPGAYTVSFDVSSAFRAVADSHEYTATGLNVYPSITASVTAYDDYMLDGEEHAGINPSPAASIGPLYAGSLTDMERLLGTTPDRYSRKPTAAPEVCFTGATHLLPAAMGGGLSAQAPSVSSVTVPAGMASGANIYGIAAPRDGYEIRFINSLGVHENVFVRGLPKKEAAIATEQYVISRQETLSGFSRGITTKQNDHETWHMTSGPVTEVWASWYAHELLMARWAWINVGGHYIPCHLLADDSVPVTDRQAAAPNEVTFRVQMDINGPVKI